MTAHLPGSACGRRSANDVASGSRPRRPTRTPRSVPQRNDPQSSHSAGLLRFIASRLLFILEIVRRFTAIAALLLMLVMTLPALACTAMPARNRTERDCCQQMDGRCAGAVKQACCKIEVRNDLNQLPMHSVNVPVLLLATLAMLYPVLVQLPASAGYLWHRPSEHSPPGLLIASTTVLRI